jgi:hypothetical protein
MGSFKCAVFGSDPLFLAVSLDLLDETVAAEIRVGIAALFSSTQAGLPVKITLPEQLMAHAGEAVMRDVASERLIERRMISRFDVDTSRIDVTVVDREATISGILLNRTRQIPLDEIQTKDLKRYFSAGRFEGVDRFYFNLKSSRLEY